MKIHVEPLPEGMWADGNRVDAFEEMYRRCYPQLVDVCRRNLCGRGDPEAVAQEAFVRAWSSLDRFSGVRPFWPWVATIARRLCIDHRRRLDREASNLHVAAAFNETTTELPDEIVESGEDGKSVVLALRRLKPSEQRVIALRDLNGWSYDEIARFEGVTVESIRGSLKRARASLRRSYARVATGAPALLVMNTLRSLRDRLQRTLAGVPHPMVLLGSGEAVVVALGVLTAGAVGPAPAPRAVAAPASRASATAPAPPAQVATDAVFVGSSDPATPATSIDGHSAGAGGGGLGLLPADGATAPEDTVLTDITASPSYRSDRTLLGAGLVGAGCVTAPCAALFRSTDGGAGWVRLPAARFAGGSVLLPPSFPHDPRIFVAGPTGLLVSHDGGVSFDVLTPIAGEAVMSPAFSSGDARVLIGQAPLWEYRDESGLAAPSNVVAPTVSGALVPLFSPRFADDGVLYVGGTVMTTGGRQQSAVFRCVEAVCNEGTRLGDTVGAPSLTASPAGDGTVAAWRGDRLYVSVDGGQNFSRAVLPLAGVVRDAAFDAEGRLFVGLRDSEGGQSRGGFAVSSDSGRTWRVLGNNSALSGGVESIAVPTARQIVVSLSGTAGGGILCSTDAGASWSRRCSN